MKKIKSFLSTLLIVSCLFMGTFVGCKNPFMDNIVTEGQQSDKTDMGGVAQVRIFINLVQPHKI